VIVIESSAIEDFSAFRIERHHMTDLLAHILDLRRQLHRG
jgi:hypothetical protein